MTEKNYNRHAMVLIIVHVQLCKYACNALALLLLAAN